MRKPFAVAGLAAGLLLAAGATFSSAQAAPRVVASVKPVHSLVAAVMQGVAAPRLLIEGAESPHTYSLAPSEALALEQADLVVWVGPALESFLERPLAGLSTPEKTLRLMQAGGVRLLPTRAGGAWEAHGHDHGHGHGHEHGHAESAGGATVDPHIWLDPNNARALLKAIAGRLARLDPEHATQYRSNAQRADARIAALDAEIGKRLAPVRDTPFIVFHDAYQYMERHYRLNAVGAITLNPQRTPSARRLYDIRRRIVESGARCVFREPQFAPQLVDTVVEDTPARVGVLDPLGAELAAGPDAYPKLMETLADSIHDCLARGS